MVNQDFDPNARPIVVGIGELLWDCFGDAKRPGGAPANVAFHAEQFGAEGVVCSSVGADALGDELLAHLDLHGLSTRFVQRDPEHPTGTVTVALSDAGQATYTIREDVAWDHISWEASLQAVMEIASVVCFGTLAQRRAQSRETIQRCIAQAKNATVVYDVNLRPPWYSRDVIETSLNLCHVLKLNEDEAPVLGELLGLSTKELEQTASALRDRFEIQTVCITRGSGGCLVCSAGQTVDLPGQTVKVADTVGAGDAFTAAMVCGLAWRWPLERAAKLADAVGALVATHEGAMPNLRNEYAELVAHFASKPGP